MNNDFMREIGDMIEQMQSVVKVAVSEIKSQVDYIIRKRVTDEWQIETLLDRLLDYAGIDDSGLALFKHLCRYYYAINPKATEEYVLTYKDLYEDE